MTERRQRRPYGLDATSFLMRLQHHTGSSLHGTAFERLIIRDDKHSAAKYLADYIISRIKAFAPTPAKPFVIGLPTGSSPEGIYKHLVAAHKRGEISFRNVITFNMDEYVGIPREHPES
ncbi:hypothetical protein KC332_g18534, partial [Hortaea werneckii]